MKRQQKTRTTNHVYVYNKNMMSRLLGTTVSKNTTKIKVVSYITILDKLSQQDVYNIQTKCG
jgi:hypothetical protein